VEILEQFGDNDGVGAEVLLQHPLGVLCANDGQIYLTDSYNHKVTSFGKSKKTSVDMNMNQRECGTYMINVIENSSIGWISRITMNLVLNNSVINIIIETFLTVTGSLSL